MIKTAVVEMDGDSLTALNTWFAQQEIIYAILATQILASGNLLIIYT